MTSVGTAGYLVDANILIYAYDPADAVKRSRAIVILRRLRAQRSGTLSTQVLGEFFWNSTRKLRPSLPLPDAERQIMLWMRSWTVLDLTPLIVLEAIGGVRRHGFPYWDALIWATAKLNGIATVLSEDFNDGAIVEGVRFRNPLPAAFDPMTL